ncbi:oligosaccharide flippase family protein [Flavobacterium sp.]|uniref:oligosaccharide flippase family protein n=1 Tax=Flavobacterium sp. TaxID=239 RepID=UPI00333FDDB1
MDLKINPFLNFLNIGIIKILNIGSKYILVGYLIRVLGENGYGTLTWVDSIVQYFIMLINFGFDLYAAKYIVENKNNPKRLNEVITSIYYIKSLLFLLCFILLIPLSFNLQINNYLNLISLMLILGLGEVLMPIWFFQGIEKMKSVTILTFTTKLLLILLTIFFIKKSNDINLYIVFLVFTNAVWGLLGFLKMKKEIQFEFIKISKLTLIKYLKEGYLFFIGKVSTFIFNMGTLFIIGYFYSKGNVAGFDIAIKIVFVFIIPFEVLQQAIYPKFVRGINKSYIKKILIYSFFFSLLMAISTYIFSEKIISIFGGNTMIKYNFILPIVLPLIPIVSSTIILGNCIMVANGYFKEYNRSLIITAFLFVLFIIILKATNNLNLINIIIVRVLADLILLLIRLYYCLKYKLI